MVLGLILWAEQTIGRFSVQASVSQTSLVVKRSAMQTVTLFLEVLQVQVGVLPRCWMSVASRQTKGCLEALTKFCEMQKTFGRPKGIANRLLYGVAFALR